jgi:ribose 5-phosphate isomerase B
MEYNEQADTMEDIRMIHLATDHAGFDLKETVKIWLEQRGYEVTDHGAFEYDEEDDYPDFIALAAKEVAIDPESRAIIFGGSGQGEAIVANRFPGVRAVVFNGQYQPTDGRDVPAEIITARQHNDANVLSLGARFLSEEEALEAIELWLETAFSGEERHLRRIQKTDQVM